MRCSLILICLLTSILSKAQLTFNDIYRIEMSIHNLYHINRMEILNALDTLKDKGIILTEHWVSDKTENNVRVIANNFFLTNVTNSQLGEKVVIGSGYVKSNNVVTTQKSITVETKSVEQYLGWLSAIRTHPDLIKMMDRREPMQEDYQLKPGVTTERSRINISIKFDMVVEDNIQKYKATDPVTYRLIFTLH